jgi:hypothetical protein
LGVGVTPVITDGVWIGVFVVVVDGKKLIDVDVG